MAARITNLLDLAAKCLGYRAGDRGTRTVCLSSMHMRSATRSRLNLWAIGITAAVSSNLVADRAAGDEMHVYEGRSIQSAIDAASGGDEIIVHPGTYQEAIDLLGKAITVRSTDPEDPEVVENTIIDGNGAYHVVRSDSGETPATVIAGFTLTGGDANGSDPDNRGGGVFCCHGSSPTLTNCTISGNSAKGGGGVYCDTYANPTLTNCTISGNSAKGGGGVYCGTYASPTLTNCTISGNSASSAGGGVECYDHSNPILADCTISGNSANFDGGGVDCYDHSNPILTNCTISGNSADYDGGGVDCHGSSPTLMNCAILGNSAELDGGGVRCHKDSSPTLKYCTISGNSAGISGGGLSYYENSSPALVDCTISDNLAGKYSGGVDCYRSSPTLINCAISGNSAGSHGGGVGCWYHSTPTMTNCTISGNSAVKYGGGVLCYVDSCPTLTNCTISNNRANQDGGGVHSEHDSSPKLTNCVLWGDNPQEIHLEGSSAAVATYCDVQGGWMGEGNIDTDPFFVDSDNSDYHLSAGSPCIDAADNTAVPDWLTTDLDGNPRFMDDPDTADTGFGDPPIVDMGAFEFQGASCPADVNDSGVVDHDDILAALVAWGTCDDCPEDINDDGKVNIDDIFEVLAAWGACP